VSLEALLVGGLAVLIGTAFAFAGYPLFLILLPIWAFLYGLIVLGGAAAASLGGGFLGTTVAIGLGALLGVCMAVLAYAFWWAGVIILGATIGWLLGTGLLSIIGIDAGLLSVIVGFAFAAVLGVLFVMYRMPRVVVEAITAAAGAATAVGGALVILGIVSIDTFKEGPIAAVRNQGFVAAGIAVAIALVGFVAQMRLAKDTEVQIWRNTIGDSV
jgi:hypothetical protein